MMLTAHFAGMKRTKIDGSWSGFSEDIFIKDEALDHTADAAKDIIMDNAESLDAALAGDRYKQNLRMLEIVPSIRRYREQRRLTALVPFGKILGRARHLGGRYAFNGGSKAETAFRLHAMAAIWAALRGFWFARSPWSRGRLIFLSRIGIASISSLTWRIESAGPESMSIPTCPIEGQGIRNCRE